MDDILIASETIEQNLTVLKETLTILKKYGFELNHNKCHFLRKSIEFLGYILSKEGITLSPRHTQAIEDYKTPTNIKGVQRFLGFLGYFRKFIKDFAFKAKPLYNLLKKNVKFDFDNKCLESFNLLKK